MCATYINWFQKVELYTEFISIESLLKELKNNSEFQIKKNNSIGYYSIEALKMF